jgi:hypothetical protein
VRLCTRSFFLSLIQPPFTTSLPTSCLKSAHSHLSSCIRHLCGKRGRCPRLSCPNRLICDRDGYNIALVFPQPLSASDHFTNGVRQAHQASSTSTCSYRGALREARAAGGGFTKVEGRVSVQVRLREAYHIPNSEQRLINLPPVPCLDSLQ